MKLANPTLIAHKCARFRAWLLIALSTALAGCNFSTKMTEADLAKALEQANAGGTATHGRPKLDVAGQSLGESQEVSISAEDLGRRVQELMIADHHAGAARMVQRNPEAALALLRAQAPLASNEALNVVAAVHDAQCVANGVQQNWRKILADVKQHPEAFKVYAEARKQFQTSLTQGQLPHALRIDLPKLASQTGAPLLAIDALQLHGSAELLNDQPEKAVGTFTLAFNQAARISEYQAAYLQMLLSDAQRRTGNSAAAIETWRKSATSAAHLLVTETPVLDPVLWEKVSYLRPVNTPWPAEIIKTLQQQQPLPGQETADLNKSTTADVVIWNAIGQGYLQRGHAQAALVSFKRAEFAATEPVTQQWLRLRQSRALIQLGQVGPATAVLMALAHDKTSIAYRPATGLLGSLRLKSGQLQVGLGLLKAAIEGDDTATWPERAEAEGDLGLAYLMIGDQRAGFDWLHRAQKSFEEHGDWEALSLSWENEAAFLDSIKKKNEASALRGRIKHLESGR